jgi:hypothetical protein
MTKIQWPDVIKPKNVIGMTMSNQDRIEMSQARAQRLLAKVGRSINDDRLAGVFNQD